MFGNIRLVLLVLTALLSFRVVSSTVVPELWVWVSGSTEEALAQVKAHNKIVSHASYGNVRWCAVPVQGPCMLTFGGFNCFYFHV